MQQHIPRGAPPLLFALLLFGILSTVGCIKIKDAPPDPVTPINNYPTTPPTELPAATQTGAGTLGCKINGRVWTFWIPPIALTPEQDAQVTESSQWGESSINARIWSADTLVDQYRVNHDIGFSFLNPFFEERTFSKAGGGTLNFDEFRFRLSIGNQPSKRYYPDTSSISKSNNLIIDNLDLEQNIISGRFEVTLYRGNNFTVTDWNDSLKITDGRFDFKYRQQ